MARLRQGRTSFVIAHRLSTIRNADTIIVMDNGRIVEHGDHAELLQRQGMCYSLYNS
jgi:ATP-binding cassette, subfamily B, multidrug efflux pump